MDEITSKDNQHLKFARAVRDGREADLIFIEGSRLAEEAVQSKLPINKCFTTRSFVGGRGGELVQKFIDSRTDLFYVSDAVFNTIADTENPQGIIAIAARPMASSEVIENCLRESDLKLVVLLHQINNPANLGAVLRTAESAGVSGVVTTAGSADAFSPKSLRASMGSAFRLPVWENTDMDHTLEWAREAGLKTTSLDIDGRSSIYEVDWQPSRLLIFGSEAHGLEKDFLANVDEVVTIPMATPVESLNLAVSCGITLFEARRQILSS
jgi:TrmH family RNA methyltransferase